MEGRSAHRNFLKGGGIAGGEAGRTTKRLLHGKNIHSLGNSITYMYNLVSCGNYHFQIRKVAGVADGSLNSLL